MAHANRVVVKAASLTLIIEPLLPELITIRGSHPIRCSWLHLDYTTTGLSATHSNQATTTISGWGESDHNVSLGILDSSPAVQRWGIGQSGNDDIKVNPPGTIGCNSRGGSGWRVFDILFSTPGISDFAKRRAPWYDAKAFSEILGLRVFLKLKMIGEKIMRFRFK